MQSLALSGLLIESTSGRVRHPPRPSSPSQCPLRPLCGNSNQPQTPCSVRIVLLTRSIGVFRLRFSAADPASQGVSAGPVPCARAYAGTCHTDMPSSAGHLALLRQRRQKTVLPRHDRDESSERLLGLVRGHLVQRQHHQRILHLNPYMSTENPTCTVILYHYLTLVFQSQLLLPFVS